MLLLKLGSVLPNLVKNFQSALKIWTKFRLNFHEVEYFHEVECTWGCVMRCQFFREGELREVLEKTKKMHNKQLL